MRLSGLGEKKKAGFASNVRYYLFVVGRMVVTNGKLPTYRTVVMNA